MDKKRYPYSSRNYREIQDILDAAMAKAKRTHHSGALLYIQMDNLPMLISGRGADFAENTMDDLVKCIAPSLDKHDAIVRTDREHLNVILQTCPPGKIEERAQEILQLIQNYGSSHAAEPIQLAASIGCVDFPRNSKDAMEVLNKAYVALNDAKEHKHSIMLYCNHRQHKQESRNQLVLANYLHTAFLEHKLRLAFQPIINSKTGKVDSYECLLRIVTADGSLTSAGPFIPVAEKLGLMDAIDGFVLHLAVEELRNNKRVKLGVNVSHASIHNKQWQKLAKELLRDPQIAKRLTVEITETAEQHDITEVRHFVEEMHALGCRVALDDFGTGYTSFTQLQNLPIDIIKIDGSFVRGMSQNKESKLFVKTLLDFSENFGLQTVAEFVENKQIADELTKMNVSFLQGHYFSPAMNTRPWMKEEKA